MSVSTSDSDRQGQAASGFGSVAGHSGHGSGHGTWSVCPVCLRRVPAQRRRKGNDICLAKHCPEHGSFEAVIWRGKPDFADWVRPKTPSRPVGCFTEVALGCPFDCGLCPDHGQHTCTALLEITQRCNLGCPVCFADAGRGPEPDLATIRFWYERARQGGGRCNIQLSGGEPTVREDLPEIIALGRKLNFDFIQLNSNGLKLAEDGYAHRLREAGLASVFLQFDGLDDAIHQRLRGRPLAEIKRRAVERCAEAGLGVVLVPTVVPGINDRALGDILRFALSAGPLVRGVHFQPISYFGRYPEPPADADRVTLPEIMRLLEEQTRGLVRTEHFRPPGCEHALCSFHGNFLRAADGALLPLTKSGGACCPQPAAEGARQSIAYTARQWAGIGKCACEAPTGIPRLEDFADQARTWLFSISAMAFQDAWTLDLERLKGCCIHVVAPDGRLVPFCAYNLTSAEGRPLYRGQPFEGRLLEPPCQP